MCFNQYGLLNCARSFFSKLPVTTQLNDILMLHVNHFFYIFFNEMNHFNTPYDVPYNITSYFTV